MEDFDALQKISEVLTKVRNEKKLSIVDIYQETNIPIRRIKQIESFDQKFFQNNKLLFVRYCKIYQDYLKITDDENFDRISENYIKEDDDILEDLEQSIKPSANNFEIAIILSIILWLAIGILISNKDKQLLQELPKDKLIYFENLTH